jgi:hypothetical protein
MDQKRFAMSYYRVTATVDVQFRPVSVILLFIKILLRRPMQMEVRLLSSQPCMIVDFTATWIDKSILEEKDGEKVLE